VLRADTPTRSVCATPLPRAEPRREAASRGEAQRDPGGAKGDL